MSTLVFAAKCRVSALASEFGQQYAKNKYGNIWKAEWEHGVLVKRPLAPRGSRSVVWSVRFPDRAYSMRQTILQLIRPGGTKCEDCAAKSSSFGLPNEHKRCWCGAFAKLHPGVPLLALVSSTSQLITTPWLWPVGVVAAE